MPPTAASFVPSPSSIRINILWFLSLFLSLVCSSTAILVKQWLRAYPILGYSGQKYLRLRWQRFNGLQNWRVFQIAAVLPLLLQLSLVLFLLGLGDFARQLHPVVGWVLTSFTIVWLVMYTASILMPVFTVWCPYKMPLLHGNLARFRKLLSKAVNQLRRTRWLCERFKYDWIVEERAWAHYPSSDYSILSSVFLDFPENRELVNSTRVALLSRYRTQPDIILEWLLDVVVRFSGEPRDYDAFIVSAFPVGHRDAVVEIAMSSLETAWSQGTISSYSSIPHWVGWVAFGIVFGNHPSERAFGPSSLLIHLLMHNEELRYFVLRRSRWFSIDEDLDKLRWIDDERKSSPVHRIYPHS